MTQKRNRKTKSGMERIFYAMVLLITVVLIAGYYLVPVSGNQVEVRVSGEVVGRYSLSENQTVTIQGAENGKNILTIQDGKAWMREADCPDLVCVKKGKIYRVGESIICLPNKVVIEIKKGTDHKTREDEVDVIAK